jgi:hypothetical protein
MNITKINNFFSDIELKNINSSINETIDFNATYNDYETSQHSLDPNIHKGLSRLQATINIPNEISDRLTKMSSDLLGFQVQLSSISYVRYSNLYGDPGLPPHFDGDTNDLVIDYQLDSNTSWDLGVDLKTYPLENNSALLFNANEHIHWRPHKSFNEGEYIDMIFFRFYNLNNKSNYKHLKYSQNDDIFKEARDFRNSLRFLIYEEDSR